MSSTEDKAEAVGTVSIPSLTDELKTFLAECEKDFSQRYTEEEEEFSSHLQKDTSPPPIVYPWYRSQQNYRHSRGHNSRNYERDRHGDRSRYDDRDRSRHDRRDHHERRDHHNHGDHWRRNNDGGNKGYHSRYRPY